MGCEDECGIISSPERVCKRPYLWDSFLIWFLVSMQIVSWKCDLPVFVYWAVVDIALNKRFVWAHFENLIEATRSFHLLLS